MITYIEKSDVDKAIIIACDKMNEDIAHYYKPVLRATDIDSLIIGYIQQSKQAMLLTFMESDLMSVAIYRQLYDETPEQIAKRYIK
jgi:hypothetical protein